MLSTSSRAAAVGFDLAPPGRPQGGQDRDVGGGRGSSLLHPTRRSALLQLTDAGEDGPPGPMGALVGTHRRQFGCGQAGEAGHDLRRRQGVVAGDGEGGRFELGTRDSGGLHDRPDASPVRPPP